nr:hypothetical protein [Tanacetum cinerariifolium]
MSDNTTKAQCKHCFNFLASGSNSRLRNHFTIQYYCEALKTVPDAGNRLWLEMGVSLCTIRMLFVIRVFQNHLQPEYNHVSRTTLKHDAMKLWKAAKQHVKDSFLNLNASVTITTDVWSAPHGLLGSYLCVIAHWIKPETWQMMKRVIAFLDFPVPHSRLALFRMLKKVFVNFHLEEIFLSITLDNASNHTKLSNPLFQQVKGCYQSEEQDSPRRLWRCVCLKDHLDTTDQIQHMSKFENPLDFKEEILEEEVLENEAIALSDEEIALDEAASEARYNGSRGKEI